MPRPVERGNSRTLQLPQWRLLGDLAINENNVFEYGVRYTLKPVTLAGPEGSREIQDVLRQLLRVIPYGERQRHYIRVRRAGADLVERYEAFKQINQPWNARIKREIADDVRKRISEGEKVEYELYCFQTIGLPDKNSPTGSKLLDFLLRPFGLKTGKRRTIKEAEFAAIKKRARLGAERIITTLASVGIKAERLSTQDIFDLMYRWNNLTCEKTPRYTPEPNDTYSAKYLRTYPEKAPETLRTKLIRDYVKPHGNYLEHDHYFSTIVTLTGINFGRAWDGIMTSSVMQKGWFWMVVDVERTSRQRAMDALQDKFSRNLANANDTSLSAGPDIRSSEQANVQAKVLRKLAVSNESIFKVGVSFLLYANSHARLTDDYNHLNNLLAGAAFTSWQREHKLPWHQYLALSPGSGQRNMQMTQATEIATLLLFPDNTPWRGLGDPVTLLSNRWDSLVGLDIMASSLIPKYAGCLVASSGSGKTFLSQRLLSDMRSRGARIVIIEHGHSYGRFTQVLGGKFIEITPEYTINPFELPLGEHTPDDSKLSFLHGFLRDRLRQGGFAFEPLHDNLIIQAVIQTYAVVRQQRQKADGTGYEDYLPRQVTMSDFVKQLKNLSFISETAEQRVALTEEQHREARSLADSLRVWTRATPQGKFIDGESSINLDADLIYFSTSKLSSDLASVAFALISDLMERGVKEHPFEDKLFWVDEAHAYLSNPIAVDMMDKFARMGRAQRLAFWFVTNSFDELADNRVRGLIDQLTFRVFLALEKTDLVIDTFKLPQSVGTLLRGLRTEKGRFADILFMAKTMKGVEGDVLQLRPVPFEYWCYTQDNDDKKLLGITTEWLGSLEQAIGYLAEHYPKGYSQGFSKEPVGLLEYIRGAVPHAA